MTSISLLPTEKAKFHTEISVNKLIRPCDANA
jgi:hypothetical protein